MEFFDIVRSNPLYAILAILVAGLFSYILRVSFSQRQNIKDAGKMIIDTFQPELDLLIQTNDDCRHILNDAAFTRHEAAIRNNMDKFIFFQRFRLQKAWEQLAYHKDNKIIPFYAMYADYGALDKRAIVKPLAISRIQRIISIVR
jgi:hypothetical protein